MRFWQIATFCVLSLIAGCSESRQGAPLQAFQYVVDLSYDLHSGFPYIPVPGVTFPFGMEPIATIETAGVAANKWKIHEHLGTQIDAPNHFALGGRSMSDLKPDELIAPIAVIDFKTEAASNVDGEITVEHLEAWEARYGRIPDRAIIIMNSGWGRFIQDSKRYINLDEQGKKHFPGFSAEAAVWLVEERNIWGLGVDTISFDPGYDDDYRTHKALLSRDRWAIEALANLDELPPLGAVMIVDAVNVRGATGGPVRPVAVWTDTSIPPDWRPTLAGRWRSAAPEPLPDGNGGLRYLVRDFSFDDGRWTVKFAFYSDAAARQLLFSGRNEGTFEVSTGRANDGAYYAWFGFERRTLSAGTQAVAASLTQGGCGETTWRVGEEQSVLGKGCPAFRVLSKDECGGEFDLIKFQGGRLFFGARPADGSICTEDQRPRSAGNIPLVRVP